MSQQINLLNPDFHKSFDWLTATPLAIATCVMLAILGAASAWATMQANSKERLANQHADVLKTAQGRLVTMTKTVAESKPDTQLANELANVRALLKGREEILKVLEGGAIGSAIGFAEFLRGFARQTPKGLWLTEFTIGAGGNEMEIHGRMLNPASLPEYIRRLKTEKIFQGRSFASLTIQRPEEGKDNKSAATQPAPNIKPSIPATATTTPLPPSFVDFVLMPSAPVAVPVGAANPALQPGLVDSATPTPNVISTAKAAIDTVTSQPHIPEKKP
ncbi:MAG: PilN domain-containing protein [Sterolibacterium sp.]